MTRRTAIGSLCVVAWTDGALKDRFKNIDYLLAPTGGFGFKAINTDRTKLGIDGGVDDFDDALYTLGVGIAASMSARTPLEVELLETYKNKPPVATVQKSDVAVLMAVVFKM